jgi:hypothetical protein
MGIVDKILSAFRPLQVEDKFFGTLVYMKMPRGRTSYWEAQKKLRTREVELFIDAPAPESPPSTLQQQFFAQVERDLESWFAETDRILRPQFEEWTRRPLTARFEDEFTLTGFDIPNVALSDAEWEMSFDSKSDANHMFTVTFKKGVATGVAIDG